MREDYWTGDSVSDIQPMNLTRSDGTSDQGGSPNQGPDQQKSLQNQSKPAMAWASDYGTVRVVAMYSTVGLSDHNYIYNYN